MPEQIVGIAGVESDIGAEVNGIQPQFIRQIDEGFDIRERFGLVFAEI